MSGVRVPHRPPFLRVGRTFSGRGVAKVNPNRVAIATGTNMDGIGFRTVNAKPASLDLTFDRGSCDVFAWADEFLLADVNVTFIEDDAGLTHLFTRASWSGEGAEIDTSTNEVSGLKIETDSYRAV